jgi:hypothetical protein
MDNLDFSNLQSLQGLLSFQPTEDEKRKAMMMGLLGAGMGILGQNAQNPRGAGLSGAMSGGMPGLQMYQQGLTNAPKERMQNLQGMLTINKLLKDMQGQKMLSEWYAGQQGNSAGQGALAAEQQAGGAAGPTNAAAARIPQAYSSQMPPFERFAMSGVPNDTVKTLMEAYKLKEPDMQVSNGYVYNKKNVQPGFLPGLQIARDGQAALTQIGPDGMPVVSAPQGAVNTYGQYKDTAARADARYQLQTRPPLGPNQPPTYMSTLDALGIQDAPKPPVTLDSPQVQRSTAPNDAEAIRRVQEASRQGGYAAVTVPNAAGMSPLQTEAVRTSGERDRGINSATTKLGEEAVSRLTKEADAQRGIINTLDTIEKIVQSPQGIYGNTPIDRAAMIAHTQGLQSPKSINTQRIRELGSQLVLARGSLGSQVSNKDAEIYAKAAGDFQNAKSSADMLSSIQTMREIAAKYMTQTNQSLQTFQTTGQIPQYSIPSTDQLIRGTSGAAPMRRSADRNVIDFGSLRR